MKESEYLKLTPINPFTPQQERVIKCMLEGDTSVKQIAQDLVISPFTVKRHMVGQGPSDSKSSRSHRGIYGVVEELYGVRPQSWSEMIRMLIEDVILSEIETPKIGITTSSEGKDHITMSVDGGEWILVGSFRARTGEKLMKQLMKQNIKSRTDLPFDLEESFIEGKLISLKNNLRNDQKVVGVYVKAEHFDEFIKHSQEFLANLEPRNKI